MLADAYGLVDSRILWFRNSDHGLVTEQKLTKSQYEHPLYYHRKPYGTLSFILVAQVDNYIFAGDNDEIESFEKFLQDRLPGGALDLQCFSVMGCDIEQYFAGSVALTQHSSFSEVDG